MSEHINYIPGIHTDADLSSNQFRVAVLSDEREVSAASNANAPEFPLGIQQNAPDGSSVRAAVEIAGPGSVCKAEYGGSITASTNLYLASNNSGQLIAAPEEAAAGSGDLYVIAIALEDGASGEVHKVLVTDPRLVSTE